LVEIAGAIDAAMKTEDPNRTFGKSASISLELLIFTECFECGIRMLAAGTLRVQEQSTTELLATIMLIPC
jgi:hypothetical protein